MRRVLKYSVYSFLALCVPAALGVGLFLRPDLPAEEVDPKYMNAASQFLELRGGGRLHLRDEGSRSGPAIVLLHGSNASLHSWEPWVRELGGSYRIITLDLPGHGLTGRIPGDDYSTPNYVALLDEVVERLGVERFVLGGNSMGGHVSWLYALRHPEKLRGLILVNAGGYPPVGSERGPLAFRLMRHEFFRTLVRHVFSRALIEEGVRTAYNNSPVVTEALIDRYSDLNRRAGARHATALRFAQYRPGAPPPAGVIKIPALVMWGAEDALIDAARARDFARDLPNSRLVIYEGIGHMPMEESPERSAEDVRRFLDGIIDDGPGG